VKKTHADVDHLLEWLREAVEQVRIMSDLADGALLRLKEYEDISEEEWLPIVHMDRWGHGLLEDAMDARDRILRDLWGHNEEEL